MRRGLRPMVRRIEDAGGGAVKIEVENERPDGTCDVRVLLNGELFDEFVSSQAEMKVMALELGGFAMPKIMQREADEAKARRETGMFSGAQS